MNIRYLIRCVCTRGFARKNIEGDIEFLVEAKVEPILLSPPPQNLTFCHYESNLTVAQTTEEIPKSREVPFSLTIANSTEKKKAKGVRLSIPSL